MAEDNPYDSLFSAEDMAKFNALWGKRYIRIDPETKKPHANSKDRFWEIEHMNPVVAIGGNMNAPKMEFIIQPYSRTKTHMSQLPDGKGGSQGSVERNDAIHTVNARGEMIAPGYVKVEYEDFQKQFTEDR